MKDAIAVIDAHIPSMSNTDEVIITALAAEDWEFDAAALAIRTCACGVKIDGFYEYVDHLKAMMGAV